MEVDSNHRSNLQQIYSLSPLATRESIHIDFLRKTTRNGFEPSTSAVTGRRSNQLSHRAVSGIHLMYPQNHILKSSCLFLSRYPLGQALDRLVTVSSMHLCTPTPALSTSYSSRGLTLTMGYLISRGASRLDAFSVYPFPTWLPSCRPDDLTGAPVVGPSRSSRTEDSSSQISCARAG